MNFTKVAENSREISNTLSDMQEAFSRLKRLVAENKAYVEKVAANTAITDMEIQNLKQQYADFEDMMDDLNHTTYVTVEMSNGVKNTVKAIHNKEVN